MSALLRKPPSQDSNIEFSHPAETFTPKPVVADILRTHYCIPGSIFLIEGIEAAVPVRQHYRAVRLLLGDGELCIQALLRREVHGFVDGGLVYTGCYVRLDRFELRVMDLAEPLEDVVDDGIGDPETRAAKDRERRKGKGKAGKMAYLLVWDLATVGWNSAYLGIVGSQPRHATDGGDTTEELAEHSVPEEPSSPNVKSVAPTQQVERERSANAMEEEYDDDSDLDDAFETMEVSLERASQRRGGQEASRPPPSISAEQNDVEQLPWASSDPTKALKLTALRSIPHLPYQQNWTVNILAVVASLSNLEPSHLPPYSQRTARLTDPTTSKHVQLTVFLDPDSFNPKVGSVVLLVGVKNHRFDGGCLKKYASDRPKNGTKWWFEDPWELGWCDVAGLKSWWAKREAEL